MSYDPQHIARLLYKHFGDSLSTTEAEQLSAWLAASPEHARLLNEAEQPDILQAWIRELEPQLISNSAGRVFTRIENEVIGQHKPILRQIWLRYAAAIIILFGIGAYLWNNYISHSETNAAAIKPYSTDILPGGQKAILTLADGRRIILDSAANGQIAIENGSEVMKKGGQIIYKYSDLSAEALAKAGVSQSTHGYGDQRTKAHDGGQIRGNAITYNTMSTPKGGQYQLTLSDGTKVWLNAASSITYPTIFNGTTREVKVEGEVYFEVAQNKNKPFIVQSGNDKVMVLGTSFNINNYLDEPASKISLIEGAIKVNEKLLQPSQAYMNGKIIQTDIEQDIAWKNGVFNFNGATLQQILRQLARWYDLDIRYEGKGTNKKLTGELSRNLSLFEVIRVLQDFKVNFRIKDKTLIVQ